MEVNTTLATNKGKYLHEEANETKYKCYSTRKLTYWPQTPIKYQICKTSSLLRI